MTDQTTQVRAIATQLIRHAIKQIDSETACDHVVATLGEDVDVDALAFGSESAVRKARIDISWDGAPAAPPLSPVVRSPIREQLLNAIDFSYCQTLGYATPEGLLAAYEASRTQAVDEAALRDRIAQVLWPLTDWDGDELNAERAADAVLAVLPATTNHDTDTSVTPPPALTEEGRLRARVQVLEEDAERDQGLAKVGARCMRDGHQGQIESGRAIVEGHRFALSVKLNLGTGATWDAIHERVADLGRVADTVTGPVCKDAEGCHRVVPCEPGCGTRDLMAEATRPMPAPVDRAAVLRDFVRELGDRLLGCCQECNACAAIARDLAAEMAESDAELRRVADETADPETPSMKLARVSVEAMAATLQRPAAGARQNRPPATAYSDGKGRVYCLGCREAVGADVPLTANDVEPHELCPSCGRHVVDVAAAGERQAETERCAHCNHPKGDHDGRTDHRAKYPPRVAGEPWCHACNAPCDYAAGARQDGADRG